MLAAGSSITLPESSGAQSSGDKQRELQHQIGDASAQELQALEQLQTIRDEKAAIDARVTELDQQIAAAQTRLADREAGGVGSWRRTRRFGSGCSARNPSSTRRRAHSTRPRRRCIAPARNGSQYATALAAPPEAMVQSDAYLDTVSAKRRRIVERVERLRDEIESQRRAVEADKEAADAAREAAQVERDGIAALRAEIEPARAQAAERQAAEEQALASIQARKAEFEGEPRRSRRHRSRSRRSWPEVRGVLLPHHVTRARCPARF